MRASGSRSRQLDVHASLSAAASVTRYALRGLVRAPVLTAALLLSFSLGVGANIAMFTVLGRILFQAPVGVKDPASIRRIMSYELLWRRERAVNEIFSRPVFNDFRTAATGTATIEAFGVGQHRLIDDGGNRTAIASVSAGWFDLLGVRAYRGRTFTAEDDRQDATPTAVISYALWNRVYGADSEILGKRIHIDTLSLQVIGVAPRGFSGTDLQAVDIWTPFGVWPKGREVFPDPRSAYGIRLIARLQPGVSEARLAAVLNLQYRRTQTGIAHFDKGARILPSPLLEARGPGGLRDQDVKSIDLAKRLSAVALLALFVAVANVASLLLMRTIKRRREIAVRLALGASRRQIGTQLFAETAILALIASGLAALVGAWAGGALRTMLFSTMASASVAPDHTVFAIAFALSVLMALAAGIAPLSVIRRQDLSNVLRADANVGDSGGTRLRVGLIIVQASLCMLLLGFAGAFLRSLEKIGTIGFGFDADRIVTFDASGQPISADVIAELMERFRTVPGVTSVARASTDLAPNGNSRFAIQGAGEIAEDLLPSMNAIDSNYFSTTGIVVVKGRGISAADSRGSEPVAVITEAMAKAFWPDTNPIGACIFVYGETNHCRYIVGIVHDLRWEIGEQSRAHYFLPFVQTPFGGGYSLIIHTREHPSTATLEQINRLARSILGEGAHMRLDRVTDRLAPRIAPWRAAVALFLAFGGIALLTAGIGVYGLVSYDVTQRTREIGIRIAVGAAGWQIARAVIEPTLRAVSIGLGVGLVFTLLAGRLVAAFLIDTSPYDPLVLAAAMLTVLVATATAVIVPGIRAANTDPAIALRAD